MQKDVIDFKFCDELVEEFKQVIEHPVRSKSSVYYVGVDLGTEIGRASCRERV